MSNKRAYDPKAFPSDISAGMTIREFYIGLMAAGWLASFGDGEKHPAGHSEQALKQFAEAAVKTADALIEAATRLPTPCWQSGKGVGSE